jgi:glycosyltransferase involved in cell wall biosynthesis
LEGFKMRVLYLTEESDRAEAGLMHGVKEGGNEVLVLGNAEAPALSHIQSLGTKVTNFRFRSRFDFAAAVRLRRILTTLQPSVAHAFTSRALSVLTFAALGLDLPKIGYRGTAGNLSWLNPADWITYLNPGLARIMCVSNAVRESLISMGLPRERLVTIYKGHDSSWYGGPSPRSALAELGIPDNALVVGCNANMRPVKGVDVLLRAAEQLPVDGSIHYLLVGEARDPLVQDLSSSKALKGLVHLAGFRRDGTQLMHASDIFVMPSRAREGLPKALLEAMLGARPVVASAVGGIPELVRHEVDGLLVTPDDAPALAQAIRRLLGNPSLRQTLGTSAQKRVLSDFSVSASISRALEVYHSTI